MGVSDVYGLKSTKQLQKKVDVNRLQESALKDIQTHDRENFQSLSTKQQCDLSGRVQSH